MELQPRQSVMERPQRNQQLVSLSKNLTLVLYLFINYLLI